MDPVTHALASYTLKRAAFSRIPRSATLAMLVAGTIADLDLLSSYFGPTAYLTFYRTYLHSLFASILFSFLVTLPFLRRKTPAVNNPISPSIVFVSALAAALLHLLMDVCQSAGVEFFWPISSHRFALDWVAHLDLWILGILLVGILLPLLSGLVTEEIGAKSRGPRGRIGATIALAAVIFYFALRATLHGNAVATLESRSYRGESPRRVAAFAEPGSPFRWHGVVETERAIHEMEIEVGPAASFDPDSATSSYKPEASPALDAARNSPVARRFLQTARFPKASVEKTPDGYHIILRDLPAFQAGPPWRTQALIDTDSSGRVLSEELAWSPASREVWWK